MTFFHLQGSIRWAFLFHAVMGTTALGIFLVPLLSRKGGAIHRRTGWIYTIAMILVSGSAFTITPWRAWIDPMRTPSSQSFALFLAFVAGLTLVSLWYGLVVLKHKNRTGPSRTLRHIGPPIALILAALMVETQGLRTGQALLMAFPVLGVVVALKQLKYWMNAPAEPMHWWYVHMSGMFTACISTITAFLVTVVPRMTSAPIARSPVLWMLPGIILVQVLNRWTARYRKQFESRAQGAKA